MKVNFFVEDMFFFKYIGCATLAKMLYSALIEDDEPCLQVAWNAVNRDFDLVHYTHLAPSHWRTGPTVPVSRCLQLTRLPVSI